MTSSVGLGLDNNTLAKGKTFTGGSTQPSSVAISNSGGQKQFRKSLLSSIGTTNKLGMKKGGGMSQSVAGAQNAVRKFDKLIEDFPTPEN